MISEEEARRKILETIQPLPECTVSLSAALDCFSGQDLVARLPMPGFDNSAMDGYAVVARSCRMGERLRVIGEQQALIEGFEFLQAKRPGFLPARRCPWARTQS